MNEADFMRRCLKRATDAGSRLFRNNVGALKDDRGQWVKYGLCNGSSDLIGFTPLVITADMVGQTVAVFTAIETKAGRGKATQEQAAFIKVVQNSGGLAGVAKTDADLDAILTPSVDKSTKA